MTRHSPAVSAGRDLGQRGRACRESCAPARGSAGDRRIPMAIAHWPRGCTVRDRLTTDYEGTLAKVAEIGYTEVEPTSYNNMSPKDFRAMLIDSSSRCRVPMRPRAAPAWISNASSRDFR